MQFTDSHCHLDSETFSKQLPSVLTQCNNLSINRIIIPAISPKNSPISSVDAVAQEGEDQCIICATNRPAIAPLCGHLVVCCGCSQKIEGECPICRTMTK